MFKIYYGNGATYTGPPELAPKRGVQAILQPNNDGSGYHVAQQGDFYLWREDWGMWQAADEWGYKFYICDPGWKCVLFGETVLNSEYAEITRIALAEMKGLNK